MEEAKKKKYPNLAKGVTSIPNYHKSVVLLISIFFPPERNGGATGSWNRAMTLYKLGYSVFVISSFPAYHISRESQREYKGKFFCIETVESITIIRLKLLSLAYAGYMRRLILFLNFVIMAAIYLPKILNITGRGNLAFVYARSPVIFSSLIGLIYSINVKSFFIYEAPDLWPEELVVFKTKLFPVMFLIGKYAANLSFKIPDTIITISDLAASYISKEYKPKASVYGIPVGVDLTKFHRLPKDKSRAELIEKMVIPSPLKDKFIILYSGILSKAQQIENLVYAADRLRDEKEVVILIIGEGPEEQSLNQMKLKLKLDNLYILSPLPRELMPLVISSADVCTILLSPEPIFYIALPTKFYEYLACCKPLIGVCRGEVANIISQYNIGRTINPGEIDRLVSTIKDFKNSPDLMQCMEDNFSDPLARFSLDGISHMFQDILVKEMKKKSNRH